ncbi:DJ-1/PfpI family protein-like protein [Ophiobolus disseminans]|uniref:DJ-1/PfpI family protein-like protein n=1 Tax=Ophiobolus disseminans TaxID=1469910 RepID=A0A6A6ZM59_9PLEO|nr:DJ-1/PfpI family protein-like protein [Ophiobolus disseminans]
MPSPTLPSKIAILLFPGFQLLDAAGPLDAFNLLSNQHTLTLYILAATLDPVSTQHWQLDEQGSNVAPSIVPTHTFADAPTDIDMLLLPGGMGARGPKGEENTGAVVQYLKTLDLSGAGSIKHVLTVCTGSEVLARTGLLDGRNATTNKRAFNDVKAKHPQVNWVAKARWVVDGNIWTSSGISAGMDLAFAWMSEVFGEEVAAYVADRSEYERNVESGNDRFAERWGAV